MIELEMILSESWDSTYRLSQKRW